MRIALLAVVCTAACTNPDTAKRRYLENGNKFASQQKYTEAILEYRNALQIDDKFPEARVQLAEAYAASGNTEGAFREYKRAADLLPDDASVQNRAATLLFMAGQFEDVRTRVEAVLRKNPKDLDAQILLANAMVGLRDLEGGVREIEEAVALDPTHAATYTNLALLKLAQGQRQAAQSAFEKAVALDPTSLKARLALTHFLLATGNLPMAEKTLNDALKIAPDDPLANRTLAVVYLGTGRHALAEKPLKLIVDVTKSARSKFGLAEYYTREGRVKDARLVLEPLAKASDTYAEAETRLALLTYATGDRDLAKKMLNEVLSAYPSHPMALQVRARWYLADGQPAQALDRAKSAVAAAPRSVEALYLLGILQAVNNQPGAATTSFNQVLKLNPRAAAAQIQVAQLRLTHGESDAAVGLAQEAVANAPSIPEARLVLARALVAEHDFTRAEVEINQLLSRYPRASGVYSIKGTLHLLKGDTAAARQAYQKAFDLAPDSIAALTGLTMLDVQQHKVDAARVRVESRLGPDAKRPDVLVLAGRVYLAAGDAVKAEQVLRRAIQLAPGMPDPYMMLVDIYRAQQRLPAAQADYDAIVVRDAGNIGARIMAATLVHAQNNPAEAKRRYAELLAVEPRAVIAANNLAWIYADERQNLDAALDLAGRATEQLPEYAEAWDTLGWVYFRKQLPLLAIDPFEKAVSRDPGNATFHYHLALAFIGGGDRAKARESLERALKLQPDFKDAQKEMRALDQ